MGAVVPLQRGVTMKAEEVADMRITKRLRATCGLAFLAMWGGAGPVYGSDTPSATAPGTDAPRAAAATPEDLPYGSGYEAREAARASHQARPDDANSRPAEPVRKERAVRDHAPARGSDRPRSDTRPPRPERSR